MKPPPADLSAKRQGLLDEALPQTRRHVPGERAVLVAAEFTGLRPQVSPAAHQARIAASLLEQGAPGGDAASVPASVRGHREIDFDASLAEFQELARSAGADTAALTLRRC